MDNKKKKSLSTVERYKLFAVLYLFLEVLVGRFQTES